MNDLVKYLGGSAILVVAIAWLVRSIIVHYLNKDIDSYKSQLELKSSIELEMLKAKLASANETNRIRVTGLYEKQAKLVEELYRDVIQLERLATLLLGNFVVESTIADKVRVATEIAQKYVDFNARFHVNRLYYTSAIVKLMDGYKDSIFDFAMKFLKLPTDADKEAFLADVLVKFREHDTRLETVRAEIEKEFKKLLGVEHAI